MPGSVPRPPAGSGFTAASTSPIATRGRVTVAVTVTGPSTGRRPLLTCTVRASCAVHGFEPCPVMQLLVVDDRGRLVGRARLARDLQSPRARRGTAASLGRGADRQDAVEVAADDARQIGHIRSILEHAHVKALPWLPAHLEQKLARAGVDLERFRRARLAQRAAAIADQLRTRPAQRIDQLLDEELPQIIGVERLLREPLPVTGDVGEHVDERAGADRDGVDLERGQCIEPHRRNGRRHAGGWPAGLVVDHDMLGRQHHRVDVLHPVREQNDMPRLGLVGRKRAQRLDRSLQSAAHRGEIGRYDVLTVHIAQSGSSCCRSAPAGARPRSTVRRPWCENRSRRGDRSVVRPATTAAQRLPPPA